MAGQDMDLHRVTEDGEDKVSILATVVTDMDMVVMDKDGEDMEDAVSDVEPSVPLPSTQVILTMSGRKTTDVSESRSKLRQCLDAQGVQQVLRGCAYSHAHN